MGSICGDSESEKCQICVYSIAVSMETNSSFALSWVISGMYVTHTHTEQNDAHKVKIICATNTVTSFGVQ